MVIQRLEIKKVQKAINLKMNGRGINNVNLKNLIKKLVGRRFI